MSSIFFYNFLRLTSVKIKNRFIFTEIKQQGYLYNMQKKVRFKLSLKTFFLIYILLT